MDNEARIRKRVWYGRYAQLADEFLKTENVAEQLRVVNALINDISGYRFATQARYAEESMEQVIKDKDLF